MTATQNTGRPSVINAIRIAYRVAWVLPPLEAAELVRDIASSWRGGDIGEVNGSLGALQFALGNLPGAWSQYTELRRSRLLAI